MPAGLDEAAAIIGIVDFGLKGIYGVYNFFVELSEAKERLPQIWHEINTLESKIKNLEFLNQIDEDTQKKIKETDVGETLNDCNRACESFSTSLRRWTKGGVDSLGGKMKLKFNASQIQKNLTIITFARRSLTETVGIVTLKLSTKTKEEKEAAKAEIVKAVQEGVVQAEQRLNTVKAATETEDDDSVIGALDAEKAALERFIFRGKKTADFVQSVKLNQTIVGVYTGKKAEVQVGIDKDSVDKVAQQQIADIRSEEESKVKVGVF